MKTLSCLVLSMATTIAVSAQSVTVTTNGNRNTHVAIDGRAYSNNQNGRNEIVINNLSTGQHSLQIYRMNGNGRRNNETSTTFYVNPNRDLHITVNGNGRVQMTETSSNAAYGNGTYKRNRRYDRNNGGYNNGDYNNGSYNNGYGYRTPMNDADFNNIFQGVKSKWLPGSKMSAARDAFNNTGYYFTTGQAEQIIALLSSEANRVELAELSFDNIVDPQNFRNIYNLFSSQSSRDQVDNYIRTNYGYNY